MKIAYKHILRHIEDKPNIEELSSKLFQLGHEHEIEDAVFDMEFTPNRGDCLSVQGIARDLNVFYKTNLEVPIYGDDIPALKLNFINEAEDCCPQISFLNIEIEGKVSEYKDYLENYFGDLKLNKNNFFTDISNYVAYEMGQPTHSYDFSTLGDDITLKINNDDTKFTTLLNNTINIDGLDLVFASNKKVINLSGIMGGLETSCNKKTTNALIECAYFRPESIIGKAVKYNLHSDASHKFERGTDPECHEKALRRFIQIVSDHSKITKLQLYKYAGPINKQVELDFNLEKVTSILGFDVDRNAYKDSLIKLGFEVDDGIKVPSFRSDITHHNDLAEEFARVVGYDNIPVSSFYLGKPSNEFDSSIEKKIKHFLVDNNFIEVINSSFCSVKSSNSIKVDNPLDSNREYMRTNLIDSLTENVVYNEKRQKDSIKFFEISDVYTSNNKKLKTEKRLAIIVSGRGGENYINFSQILNDKYLIDLFSPLGIDFSEEVFQINRDRLDSKIKTPIFGVEISLETIKANKINYIVPEKQNNYFVQYEPISEFPSSYRDISFSINDSSKINEVTKKLEAANVRYLKKSFMFDFYKNNKKNETKIGYRFIFQSFNKTLTDQDINISIEEILKEILLIDSVSIPGR